MGTSPNSGISAIQDLLRFAIDSLYITGFSFFQADPLYYDGYRGRGPGSHKQQPQIEQVRDWIRQDSRIHMDEAALRILSPGRNHSAKELDG